MSDSAREAKCQRLRASRHARERQSMRANAHACHEADAHGVGRSGELLAREGGARTRLLIDDEKAC